MAAALEYSGEPEESSPSLGEDGEHAGEAPPARSSVSAGPRVEIGALARRDLSGTFAELCRIESPPEASAAAASG